MSIKDNPLVSIIVRTKDRAELLKKALNSIYAQDYRPIEVIIINDGGAEIPFYEIQRILCDIEFRYIDLRENYGRAYAGNTGIKFARGEFIGFLDDDDEFYPEHVSTLVSALHNNDYLIAYTDSETVEYEYDKDKVKYLPKNRYVNFSEDFSYEKIVLKNYIPVICLLFRKEIFNEFKFDEGFELFEDWDLLIRIAEKYDFFHVSKVTAIYNRNLSNQISSEGRLHMEAYRKIFEKHKNKFSIDVLFHNWQELVKIDELKKEVNLLKNTLKGFEDLLIEKERFIKEVKSEVARRDEVIRLKEYEIEEKEEELTKRYLEITELSHKLQQIYDSVGWQIIERLRDFVNKVLPAGTRMRYYHDLLMKGMKLLMKQGLGALIKGAYWEFYNKKRFISVNNENICYEFSYVKDNKCLDIVIPVYNAYEELSECIKSIRKNTDLNTNRLIIIDDASTDQRIKNYLTRLKQELNGSNLYIIFNDENLGFTKSVNKGMSLSSRDVIILNSDVIVTPKWIDKLRRAAYISGSVATVTPFSNNATICSIPVFCENNSIPDGFDVFSFSEFIERISLRYYPELPTGVGFCMYIKRKTIDEIGFFDEINFNGGYGSENDFCWKAVKRGYINILDDSTFIYHKGGASYGNDKKLSGERVAMDIISKLHPDYLPSVNIFIKENPLRFIHEYLNLRLKFCKEF